MIYTINNCIRAFGYTDFNKLVEDKGSIDGLKEYVRANGYADIAVAEDTELLLVDVNGKTLHTGCYGAQLEPEVEPEYLCFTISCQDSSTFNYIYETSLTTSKKLYYKINDGEWLNLYEGNNYNINNNDKLYLKSDDEVPMCTSSGRRYIHFGNEIRRVDISGNIMSLMNFSDNLPEYCFNGIFAYNNNINDASKLILPNIVSVGCYYNMFRNCTSLINAPALPATTLAQECYYSMFAGCTSLTTTPELPATTLADGCYRQMFSGCTSLTTTPELHATALAPYCCYEMFKGCTSLTTAPALPATTLFTYCYKGMFKDCTSLVQASALPATTLDKMCYSMMFSGCTSLTQAPELPTTTLTEMCYYMMFSGCTKLNYVKAMFTDISAKLCLASWLDNVSSTGTFVKNAAATWDNTEAGIPSGWTVQTASPDK